MSAHHRLDARLAGRTAVLPLLFAACLLAPMRLEAAFEDLGSGARAPAMGNAFTALADDVHAHYYNPAGLATLDRSQFSATYSRLHMGLSDGSELSVSQMAYAYPFLNEEWGTVAVAWHETSLSGMYRERSIFLSYGRLVWEDDLWGELYAGGSLKRLSVSFDRPPEAGQACDFMACNKGTDPVLSGDTGRSLMDTDLGLLYQSPRKLALGLAIRHLSEPDLAFNEADAVPLRREVHLGLAYKVLWMNLASDFKLRRAPDGSADQEFTVAAERYFPTLRRGQLGVRSSLSFGSRDYRQIGTGLSYRINKIQFDYGFLMPLGSVKGTVGTHRFGFTFHFGAPTPQEEYTEALIQKMQTVRHVHSAYQYEFKDLPSPLAPVLDDEAFGYVKAAIDAGQYEKAFQSLSSHLRREASGVALVALGQRLDEVRRFYASLDPSQGPWAEALRQGISDFLYGRDRTSMLRLSHALSLEPKAPMLELFVLRIEEITGVKAERVPEDVKLSLLRIKLNESETMFMMKRPDDIIRLCEDILVLEPEQPAALARMGSALWLKDDYRGALAFWRKALAVETVSRERQALKYMIGKAEKKLAPPPQRKPPRRKASLRRRPVKRATPQAIERLYQYGVEHYSKGRWMRAAASFQKILELDPDNAQARRALRRVENEIMTREGR